MTARLADLLARSGTMRWSVARSVYSSDLGFGGALFPLSTAAQIWNHQAGVTVDMLVRSVEGPPTVTPHPRPTQADVVATQQELRHQFELADANWQNWTPR